MDEKMLGISLIIVLTLILAIPSISFAERFIDSFNTYIPHSEYYGYYEPLPPYYYESAPYYYYGPSVGLNFGFVFR